LCMYRWFSPEAFLCIFKMFRVKHMTEKCTLICQMVLFHVHPASGSEVLFVMCSYTAQLYQSPGPDRPQDRHHWPPHDLDRRTSLTGGGLHHGPSRAGALRIARPGAAALNRRSRRDRRLARHARAPAIYRSGTRGKSAQAMRQYSLLKVFSPFSALPAFFS
jgi:hypothetical protein